MLCIIATILVIFHWGNFSKVAFLSKCEIFRSSNGGIVQVASGKCAYMYDTCKKNLPVITWSLQRVLNWYVFLHFIFAILLPRVGECVRVSNDFVGCVTDGK